MLEQKSQADVAKQLNNPVADLWAVNFTAEVDYMVVHPEDFGQHWGVRFQIIPALPALFKDTLFQQRAVCTAPCNRRQIMKRGIKFALLTFIGMAIAAGCAPTNVQQQSTTLAQVPRPDAILVYDFAVSPDEVTLDKGLSAELMQKYEQHKGASRTAEEVKVGHKVADAVANELVKKIRSYGLWADRSFGYPSGTGKVLMVKGQFLSIDEGNRTERVAIGLGAGRTDVQANVQVYELTPQGLKEVDTLRGTAKSGYKPGMAEMMGAGAIAGHLLMSTVVSGAVAGVSEMTSATVEADGKRLADKIAVDLGNFFVTQGWIPPDAVKKSFF